MEFYVGQQKDEWRLHQDYSSLQYEGSFWYLFYGKRDFPDELLHSIEDDGVNPPTTKVAGFPSFKERNLLTKWYSNPSASKSRRTNSPQES